MATRLIYGVYHTDFRDMGAAAALEDAVLYTAQTRTTEEQAQARANIGIVDNTPEQTTDG